MSELDRELDRLAESLFGPLPGGRPAVSARTEAASRSEATVKAFRQVGLSQEAAQIGARGLVSGEFFSFEDAVVVLNGFDNVSVVDYSRVREVARRLGGQVVAERSTAVHARLVESGRGSVTGNGLLSVVLIDAGQGASGFYPATTLEAAGRARVFGKGLQMFIDHPTVTQDYERPERSVSDLAGVLASDATYDPASQALVASATVFGKFREAITEMAPHIGLSIRAEAQVQPGADGRPVVQEITNALSVDYVTKAGRGGRILSAS